MANDADEVRVEATGETVGEAKWSALRELERVAPGLDKASARFEVLSEGERGLLGVGFTPARVAAIAPRPPGEASSGAGPRPESDNPLREFLSRISAGLGVHLHIDVREDDDRIHVSLSGTELGAVIGRHGQTIDAIETLANAVAARRSGERKEVVVDAAGYRERRRATIGAMAVRAAERALATGRPVDLEPMSAGERKIVHLLLQDDPRVETTSEGTEPHRFVVVLPAALSDPGAGRG